MKLLNVDANAKTVKGQARGFLTAVLYLAPHTLSGGNVCPNASPGCIDSCLNTAGMGVFSNVQAARIAKTNRFRYDRRGFMLDLVKEITSLQRRARKLKMVPLVRLNGTSDLPWENVPVPYREHDAEYQSLMYRFPDVQFYDYTKSGARMVKFLNRCMPHNYHLTFSRSECNEKLALEVVCSGGNTAVVFACKPDMPLPKTYGGYKVIDGDKDDVRHKTQGAASMGRSGVIIGLRAKGRAKKDTTGFVVRGM